MDGVVDNNNNNNNNKKLVPELAKYVSLQV